MTSLSIPSKDSMTYYVNYYLDKTNLPISREES